jgi:broad specificity phosphatase PhoE
MNSLPHDAWWHTDRELGIFGGRAESVVVKSLTSPADDRAAARGWIAVTRMILVRHSEPLKTDGTPADQWPLTDQGRRDASALGRSLSQGPTTAIVWTSPERKAFETAALALPSVATRVREQLAEVRKPWYITAEEHAKSVASYLEGETVHGWERRDDVVARLAVLETDFSSIEGDLIIVSHGVLLTTWLDHQIALDDPYRFWSNLRMPDAWVADLEDTSLERVVAREAATDPAARGTLALRRLRPRRSATSRFPPKRPTSGAPVGAHRDASSTHGPSTPRFF